MTGREFWDLFRRYFERFPDWENLSVRGQLAAEDVAKEVTEHQNVAHENGDAEEELGPERELRWLFKEGP